MKRFRFKRYKVIHNKRPYYVLVPEGLEDNLWIVDWADWWYGSFITGNLYAVKLLAVCFAILGFNPYLIIYFPIKNHRIPKALSGNPENGNYDMLLLSNRVQLSQGDWKSIRNKLKRTKWTRYKFTFNEERVKKYFEKKAGYVNEIPQHILLKKAGAYTKLACDTAWLCYPRDYYGNAAYDIWEWATGHLSRDNHSDRYKAKFDEFILESTHFCYGGYEKKKFTHEQPGCTISVEMYDINIANRYLQDKDYFVEGAKTRQLKNNIEGYNQFTYASTNYMKIKA